MNGKRAGVLSYLHLTEFKKAIFWKGFMVVVVRSSKTMTALGCPRVVISMPLYSLIKVYVDIIRPWMRRRSLQVPDDKWLFLNSVGNWLDSSGVNDHIQVAWGHFLSERHPSAKGQPKISTTILRHTITTHVGASEWLTQTDITAVTRYKDHSEKTASTIYDHSMRLKGSVRAATLVESIFYAEPDMPSSDGEQDAPADTKKVCGPAK